MASNERRNEVAVFGSFMIDLVAYCERMPRAGETLIGRQFLRGFGGKGANQLAMVHNLGARCVMAGCLGNDDFGDDYRRHFQRQGVPLALKELPAGCSDSTGVAQITVTSGGENYIVIVPGANHLLTSHDVEAPGSVIGAALDSAGVVLCQTEVPLPAVAAALRRGRAGGAVTILNTAPMPQDEEGRAVVRALLPLADIVCANEGEAQVLCDVTGGEVADWLVGMKSRGCCRPLVTLGADGAALLGPDGEVRRVAAPEVTCVDTTGAGDCFLGCLAVLVARGSDLEAAAAAASRVAALSVTRKGTQASYPRGQEAIDLVEGRQC